MAFSAETSNFRRLPKIGFLHFYPKFKNFIPANGCLFNTTLIKAGETGQDVEWWYTCTKSRWLISGCVVNGQRFRVGDTFQLLTRQGVFWGKCEKIDQYHYMRQPYGCVDAFGKNVDNGQQFQMNQLFWGTCSVNKTTTNAPEIGSVQVNVSFSILKIDKSIF